MHKNLALFIKIMLERIKLKTKPPTLDEMLTNKKLVKGADSIWRSEDKHIEVRGEDTIFFYEKYYLLRIGDSIKFNDDKDKIRVAQLADELRILYDKYVYHST